MAKSGEPLCGCPCGLPAGHPPAEPSCFLPPATPTPWSLERPVLRCCWRADGWPEGETAGPVFWTGNCSNLNNSFSPGKGPAQSLGPKGQRPLQIYPRNGFSSRDLPRALARTPKPKRPCPLAGQRTQTLTWCPSDLRCHPLSSQPSGGSRAGRAPRGPVGLSPHLSLPLIPEVGCAGRVAIGRGPWLGTNSLWGVGPVQPPFWASVSPSVKLKLDQPQLVCKYWTLLRGPAGFNSGRTN